MTRKTEAFWTVFALPVFLGCGCAISGLVADFYVSDLEMGDLLFFAVVVVGPSILVGLLIGFVARSLTENEPGPLECGKCGYSLIGLTSDKCPECGQELSARATP